MAKAAEKANKPVTAADFLNKGFKKPSKAAIKSGKARLLMEDVVRRAERKLEELKKQTQAETASIEEKAETLAEELFHKPGSLLTQKELAHISTESGCVDETTASFIFCRDLLTVNTFRTINGVCNNRPNPPQGASATRFRRLQPPVYEDGISSMRGAMQARTLSEDLDVSLITTVNPFLPPYPSARTVSKSIVRDRNETECDFTHLLMQFGQFLDHDMDLGPEFEEECEGCIFTETCEPIPVARDDDTFGVDTPQEGDCLSFRRAIPVCQFDTPGSFSPREQVNDLTSYIDGSMIYGSNIEQEDAVRQFEDGLLRVGYPVAPETGDTLPVDTEGLVACPARNDCFLCGDVRCNEQVSLSVMHTIWLREHNRLAKGLKEINPHWSDERLYQEARKIVGAEIQKIVYFDYLPKVMGPAIFDTLIGPYEGYDRTVDASVPNSFATAAYRYGHSLIRPFFDRLGPGYMPIAAGPLNLVDMFFNPPQIANSGGVDAFVRGWVTQESRRMDEFLNSVLTTQLFQTDDGPGMDLASLNIQRQRDHGLPPYILWRNFCQRVFPQLEMPEFENQLTLIKFLQVYGSKDTIDLWIGGLAEDRLSDSLLGATFACIFGLTFRNARDGDRFYFERPGVFVFRQRRAIMETTSFSRIFCENGDNIEEIQPDAFLSNQTRIQCNSYNFPPLDLELWREPICYIRVQLPSDLQSAIELILAVAKRTGEDPLQVFSGNAVCLPVPCPTQRAPIMLAVYPDIQDLNACTFTSDLPYESSPGQSAMFVSEQITSDMIGTNGLFRDLESCIASTTPAISWSCPTAVQSNLKASSENNDRMNNPENPNSFIEAPAGLLEKFAKFIPSLNDDNESQIQAKKDDKMTDALEKELAGSFVKDQELVTELREVMKQLD